MDFQLKIENFVVTCIVGSPIDLDALVIKLPSSAYNPKVFAALECKMVDPACTALIFGTGKFVISGCKSVDSARLAMEIFMMYFREIGINAEMPKMSVENIVLSTYVGKDLCLPLFCRIDQVSTRYNPDLFPGLTYRKFGAKKVILIYRSGKVVLMGVRNNREIKEGEKALKDLMEKYNQEKDKHDLSALDMEYNLAPKTYT